MARILVCVTAALYACLWLGVAVQTTLYQLDLALDLVELGVGLGRKVSTRYESHVRLEKRLYLLVVDRGGQYQACFSVRISACVPPRSGHQPSSRDIIVCLIILAVRLSKQGSRPWSVVEFARNAVTTLWWGETGARKGYVSLSM